QPLSKSLAFSAPSPYLGNTSYSPVQTPRKYKMNEAILLLKELIALPAGWVKANLLAIATAFTTALLVIYGDNINRAVKLRINRYPFLVRTLAFVALCSFGYGLLTVLITPSVAQLLRYFGDQYTALVVLASFLGIGILAERKRYM
ncbi:MAG: DUF3392 domain-containing protein, partial [Candidatus Latescibacteria bacterium]|nr:DUF3392 domain-containing protein [Candidatus Latescibacterota bacterium]